MHRPDDEFINQFRERFGDLLLSCHGERGRTDAHVDVGGSMFSASHAKEDEPVDVMCADEANTARTLRLEKGSPKPRNFHALGSISPMKSAKQHETFHDRNLLGSGAIFHNKAGDIHSPMIRWNTKISPFLDESIQHVQQISWNGPDGFTPLAESQRWLYDHTYFGHTDDISRTLVHHDSGYTTLDGADQDILADSLSEQPDLNSVLATSEGHVNEHWQYSDGEKFRYHVILQAPTAILRHANESPVTYLDKGQIYSLTVADSALSIKKAGLLEYRTFVHVSFESEAQRYNSVASWQLWKQGRGSKEAHERKGKVSAIEYVVSSQDDVRNQGLRQIRLEKAFVDGFCVTWTADPSANIHKAAILLKFNFLSTDFSRSKGVKGVPVRLCVKTQMLRSDDETETIDDKPENCYCLVKLYRDHGAERKLSNDKIYAKKRIEKLNKEILGKRTGEDFDGRSRRNTLTNDREFDIRPQKKRKWSISSRKGPASDKDLHAELATMAEVFSSARPVSVLGLCGNEKDDPDLYSICLSHGSSTLTKAGDLDDKYSMRAINLAYEGAACLSNNADERLDLQSPSCQERPPKMPKISTMDSQMVSPPANHSKYVACFYVQFTQNGKHPEGNHYAIYLMNRTALDLKSKLAEKLQIDPCLITRVIHVNSKGLKVVVDDDMIQQLPEARIMIADICELPYTGMAPSSTGYSEVEIKLVF
ncbi:hypothetical protein N7508_011074 [Penicillium antarcticum]|uniref:uncharacterized protein n=1 Tax=Penicillium antarcticum TaxID=416450 RepID=UPI00239D5893|nr:uncharacterized protein N7508_011074 [Penicillium antarcticum]KAJ5288299.1 hypothetical protein N7508_011074 [Penicillium antarcticum]